MRTVVAVFLLPAAFVPGWCEDVVKWAFTDYAPANYVVGDETYSGYLYDIVIEAFEKRLGISVDVEILPWQRCQRLVETGEVDMILTVPTATRLEYAEATEPSVWVKQRIVYTYKDHPRMHDLSNLHCLEDIEDGGFSVVSYIGNGWMKETVEPIGIPVLYAPSVESMYKMLDGKRADLVIEEPSIAQRNIDQLELRSTIVPTESIVDEVGFHILIGRQSEFLARMGDLNAVIEDMWADGTIQAILDGYGLAPVR